MKESQTVLFNLCHAGNLGLHFLFQAQYYCNMPKVTPQVLKQKPSLLGFHALRLTAVSDCLRQRGS